MRLASILLPFVIFLASSATGAGPAGRDDLGKKAERRSAWLPRV